MKHPTEPLPQMMGAVALISRDVMLGRFFPKEELEQLKSLIRPETPEREYVCDHGVPALIALHDTMESNAISVDRAKKAIEDNPGLYSPEALERRHQRRKEQAANLVNPVGRRIEQETAPVEIPSVASVESMPEGGQDALTKALLVIGANTADYTYIDQFLGESAEHAKNILDKIQKAKDETTNSYGPAGARPFLRSAEVEAEKLGGRINLANIYLKLDALEKDAETLKSNIKTVADRVPSQASGSDIMDLRDDLNDLRKQTQTVSQEVKKIKREQQKGSGAHSRVQFVIRYLLAMNDPNYADAPTEAERAQFLSDTAPMFSDDLELVFGGNLNTDFLEELRERFVDQLKVRDQIKNETGNDPGMIPNQASMLDYFRSLRSEDNDTVAQAYQNYAMAFFEHRIIASETDLNVLSVADLYNRPPGIGGTRRLVCSGYALLGAQLLEAAGAQIQNYHIGVRANQDQLAGNAPLTDAHAGAQVRRKGQDLFVSNDLIVGTLNGVFGPDAVSWDHPQHRLYRASGNTLGRAFRNSQAMLTRARGNP